MVADIWIFIESSSSFIKLIIRYAIKKVDKIITGEVLTHQFDFIPPHVRPEIVVVPNGLPWDKSNKFVKKTIVKNQPIKLLYLSNMIPSKGYMNVLKACEILKT